MSKKWWIANGPKSEVVLSTRIRLARNLDKHSFPGTAYDFKAVTDETEAALSSGALKFTRFDMKDMDAAEKQFMVEKHIISPNLSRKPEGTAFISEDEHISVMVNEEDHIRIQIMEAGFNFDKAYKTATLVDSLIEETAKYAYSDKYGFITACPTNIGTGMRASVMLHLPALCMTGEIKRIIASVTKFGIAVRGIYGEGSEAEGNIFQISNQITLGITEEETISNLKSVTESIIEREINARTKLQDTNIIRLADKIWRSYGILKNAQILSSDEFMKLASDVRLGKNMGIITNVDTETLNELTATIQPAGIQLKVNKDLTPEQRDFERAKLVRERL